jgi:Tol biopolymer transport system component
MQRPAALAWAIALGIALAGCSASATTAPASSSVEPAPAATASPSAVPPSAGPSVSVAAASPSASDGLASPAPFPSPLATIQGRILFSIEGDGVHDGLGGVAQPAYIDAAGLHLIPLPPDPTFGHAVWGPGNTIFFDSQRSGIRHIYRMQADGTGVTQVTSGSSSQEQVSVSASGTKIAFDDYIDKGAVSVDLGVHVANLDGSGSHAVTPPSTKANNAGAGSAALSPDGAWVAFVRSPDWDRSAASLFVVRTDGTGLRRLTEDSVGVSVPRWSPDGKQLLFTSTPDNGAPWSLKTVDVAGGAPRPTVVMPDGSVAFEGAWSPDGTRIVFRTWVPGALHTDLHVVDADGSNGFTLWVSPDHRSDERPNWAP